MDILSLLQTLWTHDIAHLIVARDNPTLYPVAVVTLGLFAVLGIINLFTGAVVAEKVASPPRPPSAPVVRSAGPGGASPRIPPAVASPRTPPAGAVVRRHITVGSLFTSLFIEIVAYVIGAAGVELFWLGFSTPLDALPLWRNPGPHTYFWFIGADGLHTCVAVLAHGTLTLFGVAFIYAMIYTQVKPFVRSAQAYVMLSPALLIISYLALVGLWRLENWPGNAQAVGDFLLLVAAVETSFEFLGKERSKQLDDAGRLNLPRYLGYLVAALLGVFANDVNSFSLSLVGLCIVFYALGSLLTQALTVGITPDSKHYRRSQLWMMYLVPAIISILGVVGAYQAFTPFTQDPDITPILWLESAAGMALYFFVTTLQALFTDELKQDLNVSVAPLSLGATLNLSRNALSARRSAVTAPSGGRTDNSPASTLVAAGRQEGNKTTDSVNEVVNHVLGILSQQAALLVIFYIAGVLVFHAINTYTSFTPLTFGVLTPFLFITIGTFFDGALSFFQRRVMHMQHDDWHRLKVRFVSLTEHSQTLTTITGVIGAALNLHFPALLLAAIPAFLGGLHLISMIQLMSWEIVLLLATFVRISLAVTRVRAQNEYYRSQKALSPATPEPALAATIVRRP